MPIYNPSDSTLTVQPTFVTSSVGGLGSRIDSAAARAAARENRSKGRTVSSVFSLGPARTAGAGSLAPGLLSGDSSVVASYDATVYDTEITSSGFTSAYPEILGIAPLVNLYDASGKFSNTGQIFKIQNTMKDRAISRASQIVEDYLEAFPASSSSLASIRDQNLQKYNTVVTYVPIALQSREDITYASEIDSYSSENELAINAASVSSFAEFKHIPIIPDTSDVETYSGDRDMTVSLSRRLLGVNTGSNEYINSFQSKTARQYQLMRAAFAQLSEGIRFGVGDLGEGNSSPYDSLDESTADSSSGENVSTVLSVSKFLSDNFSPDYGFTYAKNQLEMLAQTVMNNFCPPSSIDYDEITGYYSSRNSGFAGYVHYADGKYQPVSNDFESNSSRVGIQPSFIWATNYQYDGIDIEQRGGVPIETVKNAVAGDLPYFYLNQIGNLSDCQDFFNQAILSLAYEIMSQSKETPELPVLINPGSADLKISGNDVTIDRGVLYSTISREGKQIYMFDSSLRSDTDIGAVPISTALISDSSELNNISSQIKEAGGIQDQITDLASTYSHVVSPACALTILQVFYKHYSNYFTESILNGSNTDEKSAIRASILIKASLDPVTAGRLFRFIEDPNNNALRIVASGGTTEGGEDKRKAYSSLVSQVPEQISLGDEAAGPGSLVTFSRETDPANYEISTSDLGGTSTVGTSGGTQKKVNFDFEGQFDELASYIFDLDGSLFVPQAIVDELKGLYPVLGEVGESTTIAKKVKITAFLGMLYFIRCLNLKASCGVYPKKPGTFDGGIFYDGSGAASLASDLGKVKSQGWVRFYPEDSTFLADCLAEAFTVPSTEEMEFDNFKNFIGTDPSSSQISRGSSLFNRVRAPIKYILQASQDIRSLMSYQKTVLKQQTDNISSLSSIQSSMAGVYGGSTDTASRVLARYLSVDSISELYYRSERYQKLIPGTRISSIATRSKNYRSIVRSAFKNLIPSEEDLKLFMIGIPYGHLERLRLGQDERKFYFGVKVNCGSINDFSDDEVTISYNHDFIDQYFRTEESGGPYSSQIPELFDDFDSTEIVKSVENGNISLYRLRDDRSGIDILKRSEESTRSQRVDFPATVVQSALQSYMEDVYGLYPRFSSTKSSMRTDPYPEEEYANAALNFAGISTDTTEGLLIYNRLKSVIMMHQDFITTRMVEEQEASPLFDKIIYVVVQGASLPDVLTQIYARVEV
jgi:hypothetical protein